MGTSVKRSSNVTELFKLGLGYDIPSKPVDAMNVINVHHAVSKAANRARNGKGPSLLEFRTYRYKGHSMSDPAQYRSKKELEKQGSAARGRVVWRPGKQPILRKASLNTGENANPAKWRKPGPLGKGNY